MPNLVPEKSVDKYDVITTNHARVRTQQAPERPSTPSPPVGPLIEGQGVSKAHKARPAQLEQHGSIHRKSNYPLDDRLKSFSDRENEKLLQSSFHKSAYYEYRASDVEVYDVLAVAPTSAALKMLSDGVRSTEAAKDYLRNHGAGDLIIDRSAVIQTALKHNLNSLDFIETYDDMADCCTPENFLAVLKFAGSSLNNGANAAVINDIAEGAISFSHIKAVGVTNLNRYERLASLRVSFRKLRRGEDGYSLGSIKELVRRSSDERVETTAFAYLCRAADEVGLEEILKVKHLSNLANAYYSYKVAQGSHRYREDGIRRALYAAYFKDGVDRIGLHVYASDEFYEAGLPVEVAIDISSRGGNAREALAVHDEGIERGLAGGWL